MKIRNLFIYSAFIWMIACNPKPEEIAVETEKADEIEESNEKFAFSPETLESIKSDPFTLEAASEAGVNFLVNADSFGALEAKKYFSGIFDAKYFQPKPGKKGIRFWYCFNQYDTTKYPKFFLALEQVGNYEIKKPEAFSIFSDELIVPEIIPYTGSDPKNGRDLEPYFKSFNKLSSIEIKKIKFDKVLEFAFEFKNLMIDLDSIFGHLPSKYAVAYFEFNDSYMDFIKLNPVNIKYTMVYIPDKNHKPNFLRPVLMGIDSTGNIIIEREGFSIGTFLQKSTPPPPNQ